MKDLIIRHGEKILVIVVLCLCAYWVLGDLGRYESVLGGKGKVSQLVGQLRDILQSPKPQTSVPSDYDKKISMTIACCDNMQVPPVAPRIFWQLPERGQVKDVLIVDGELGVPADMKATALRGQVVVSWSLQNVVACLPDSFEVYRWVDKEGSPLGKPVKIVSAGWPSRTVHQTDITGMPGGAGPATYTPGMPTAGPPASSGLLQVDNVKRDYSFTDKDVEPMVTYIYRVRVKARKLTLEEVFGPGVRGKILRPAEATEETEGDTVYWVSKLSEGTRVTTPTNIEIFYKGTSGNPPLRRARINVVRWNARTSVWDKAQAMPLPGEPIIGEATVADPGNPAGMKIRIDSGFDLVKIIEETREREEERDVLDVDENGQPVKRRVRVKVPYLFRGIEVKPRGAEGPTKEYEIFSGKEEDALEAGGAPAVEPTTKEVPSRRGEQGTLVPRTR